MNLTLMTIHCIGSQINHFSKDTGFDVGSNDVSGYVKINPDEFPLRSRVEVSSPTKHLVLERSDRHSLFSITFDTILMILKTITIKTC